MMGSIAEVSGAGNALIMAQWEHGIVAAGRVIGEARGWRGTRSGEVRRKGKTWTREKANASGLYREAV
jgi:hypothetical protein